MFNSGITLVSQAVQRQAAHCKTLRRVDIRGQWDKEGISIDQFLKVKSDGALQSSPSL